MDRSELGPIVGSKIKAGALCPAFAKSRIYGYKDDMYYVSTRRILTSNIKKEDILKNI